MFDPALEWNSALFVAASFVFSYSLEKAESAVVAAVAADWCCVAALLAVGEIAGFSEFVAFGGLVLSYCSHGWLLLLCWPMMRAEVCVFFGRGLNLVLVQGGHDVWHLLHL